MKQESLNSVTGIYFGAVLVGDIVDLSGDIVDLSEHFQLVIL